MTEAHEDNIIERVVKQAAPCEVKQVGDAGEFAAVIATLGVVDKDDDIIEPGAIGEQSVRVFASHSSHAIPIGKATLREDGDQLIAEGKINLDTVAGRDWHAALKFDLEHPPALQEWSFGFSALDSDSDTVDGRRVRRLKRVKVFEISPVFIGAGVGTRTISVKAAVRVHHTETTTAPWSADTVLRRLPSPVPVDLARKVYAWIDEDRIEDGALPKAAAKLPHHLVDRDGTPGAASVRACIAGIAALNGARGGVDIPDADREATFRHLAAHLRDAGEDVPELKSADAGITLAEEMLLMAWDVDAITEKLRTLSAMRAKRGKSVSPVTLGHARDVFAACDELARLAQKACVASGSVDASRAVARAAAEWARVEAAWRGLDV